ncbi:MAG TPA: histidine phosphatase family protein [Termitinemataceae bacterium]|nr:histidine phosphatase family protein [Termitinemataceae bacterium]HOM22261.1 histidine phosphatase family protein [Termitinemataceae bacterium]HPP99317.1 histidine phosphatase family protein [Termitinemataceae bacterium]
MVNSSGVTSPQMVVDGHWFAGLLEPVECLFIRHGESEGNQEGIFQGRRDYSLTQRGREQARRRAASFEKYPWYKTPERVRVFTSPLARARQTAEIISETCRFNPPEVLDALMELDVGIWTGQQIRRIKEEEKEQWEQFRHMSWEGVPGAEKIDSLYNRALAVWAHLSAVAQGKVGADSQDSSAALLPRALICITHGGMLQWLVKVTFGYRSWFPLLPIHNVGLYRCRIEPVSPSFTLLSWLELDSPIG